MRLDIVEQARVRHAEGGFCRIVGCPECDLLRFERIQASRRPKPEIVQVTVVEEAWNDLVAEVDVTRRLRTILRSYAAEQVTAIEVVELFELLVG